MQLFNRASRDIEKRALTQPKRTFPPGLQAPAKNKNIELNVYGVGGLTDGLKFHLAVEPAETVALYIIKDAYFYLTTIVYGLRLVPWKGFPGHPWHPLRWICSVSPLVGGWVGCLALFAPPLSCSCFLPVLFPACPGEGQNSVVASLVLLGSCVQSPAVLIVELSLRWSVA